ncbi:MAG: bifunctional hydroxymethylpyrimidine kinase/phosphomethylpyrimidine kinase [Pyrinomonadaceae bacterium]
MSETNKPVCLSIAGLDPSGGAGVIADVKTFTAFSCYGAAAITSVTYQNTTDVFGAAHQSADSVRKQIEAVLDDLDVIAIKTGMLPTREIMEVVADIIRERKLKNVVVDPVIRSTSGYDLIEKAAVRAMIEKLIPLATLITPNIPETELITGVAIETEEDIRDAAAIIQSMGAANVLIKGGHQRVEAEQGRTAVDHLFVGSEVYTFELDWVDTTSTHGTGCVLSSAIAANLAHGNSLNEAVQAAKDFVTNAILTAQKIGHGNSPINV